MIVFLTLAVAAAFFIAFPWLKHSDNSADGETEPERAAHNQQVLAEQMTELQRELDEGLIDQTQFESIEAELLNQFNKIEQAASQAPAASVAKPALLVSTILLLASSVWIYSSLGYHTDVDLQQRIDRFASLSELTAEQRRRELLELLPDIAERGVQRDDKPGWLFLQAQIETELQRYPEAAVSYQQLLKAEPENADLWAQYGQVLYLSAGRKMSADAGQALQRSLSINPHQRTALGLMGMSAYEAGDFAAAEQAWAQLLAGLQPGSQQYRLISTARQRALQQMGAAQGAAESGGDSARTDDVTTAEGLTIAVSAASNITLPATTPVFIYARPADGPKMPLAIARKTLADLPLTVTLTDAMAMMPNMKLSMFDSIEVLARVSPSGNASAQKGDWQASSGALDRATINDTVSLHISDQLQ